MNLLADMGAQPATLMTGLVAATKSTDTTGADGDHHLAGGRCGRSPTARRSRVTGTATDTGGRVAGVEVSTDGGDTWHPATGHHQRGPTPTSSTGVGADAVQVRAIDDSANIGAAATRVVTVACPCSVFGSTVPEDARGQRPVAPSSSACGSRPTGDGFVTGVRFYKGTGNTGTHVGSLWSATGSRLAHGDLHRTSPRPAGRPRPSSPPVAVTAGTTYVVSYTAPERALRGPTRTPSAYEARRAAPLDVAGGFGAPPAGVYGSPGAFPDQQLRNANYYVDAVFTTTDTSPLTVGRPVGRWPARPACRRPRRSARRSPRP